MVDAGDPVARTCTHLNSLVEDAFQKHLYTTAIFYADKLVELVKDTDHVKTAVYTLAECYFQNGEYRRVLHLLNRYKDLSRREDSLKLLAAQSLMQIREYDECLTYLEEHETAPVGPASTKMASVFALLRGKVYELQENQQNAIQWYLRGIELDPYCHEALDRLIGTHLLPRQQEVEVLQSLVLRPEDEWLRHLYAARLVGTGPNPIADAAAAAAPDSHSQGEAGSGSGPSASSGSRWSVVSPEYPTPMLPRALAANGCALAAQATRHYRSGDYQKCYTVSKRVLEDDPYHLGILPVHIASLVHLEMKSVVFYIAHKVTAAYPNHAVAWFAAGCYYYLIKKYESARRFFGRAAKIDGRFAAAWIAYGHAFAHHDESDQALAAYRTASRLFPGSHLPWLFIGIEYLRTNSLTLAEQYLTGARSLLPWDALVLNELGVVKFKQKQYEASVELLLAAIDASSKPREAFFCNLGHALLKLRTVEGVERAKRAFEQAQRQNPKSGGALVGLGFAHHVLSDLDAAIELYHRALALQRDDAFAQEMLNRAVMEAAVGDTADPTAPIRFL